MTAEFPEIITRWCCPGRSCGNTELALVKHTIFNEGTFYEYVRMSNEVNYSGALKTQEQMARWLEETKDHIQEEMDLDAQRDQVMMDTLQYARDIGLDAGMVNLDNVEAKVIQGDIRAHSVGGLVTLDELMDAPNGDDTSELVTDISEEFDINLACAASIVRYFEEKGWTPPSTKSGLELLEEVSDSVEEPETEWRSIPEVPGIEVNRDGDIACSTEGRWRYAIGTVIDVYGNHMPIQTLIAKAFPDEAEPRR